MAWYEYCEKLPYTISIQFDKSKLGTLSKDFKVSSHISIKYLGYEECLTDEKINAILEKFTNLKIQKKDIEVVGFGMMDNLNLYLKVAPRDYLYELHNKVICLLDGMIDLYRCHDLKNFIPHITCTIPYITCAIPHIACTIPHITCGYKDLNQLNEEFSQYGKLHISDWFLALHTSKKDYRII